MRPLQVPIPGGLPDALSSYNQLMAQIGGFLVGSGVVYLLGRLLLLPLVARAVRARNRNNPTIATATETYVHILVVGFAVLVGLVVAGYGKLLVDSAIVFAAIAFVLGVAGQELLGSLLSGFFLVLDPDFNVGDWIRWPGGEGTVEAVDFRVTRIRTVNNETMTIPNTELTNNTLTRPFGRDRFRVTEQVFVSYADDVEHALKELADVARVDDRVLEDPPPTSRIRELGDSAVTLQAEFWVGDPADLSIVDVRSQFRRRVKARFEEEGFTLGPPSGRELSGGLDVSVTGDADESGAT